MTTRIEVADKLAETLTTGVFSATVWCSAGKVRVYVNPKKGYAEINHDGVNYNMLKTVSSEVREWCESNGVRAYKR